MRLASLVAMSALGCATAPGTTSANRALGDDDRIELGSGYCGTRDTRHKVLDHRSPRLSVADLAHVGPLVAQTATVTFDDVRRFGCGDRNQGCSNPPASEARRRGPWLVYDTHGRLRVEGAYDFEARREGLWRRYDAEGRILTEVQYFGGAVLSTTERRVHLERFCRRRPRDRRCSGG